uniref:Fibroblast growth factor n=1 Tax=Anopheles epiroticus TaxID=199890 RepID=A0A182P6R4_9DIPT
MLGGRIRRRALALLGALLLVILVWPPCCATMPKPLAAVPPQAPWDIVPPARPHPAAAVLPVPLQPWTMGGGEGTLAPKRHHVPFGGTDSERHREHQQHQKHQQQEPAESESRKSRRVSEFHRLLRALSPATQPRPTFEPNERRQSSAVSNSATAAVQLNLPPRENSAVRDVRDYLIEPKIDKNKSQSASRPTLDLSVAGRAVAAPPSSVPGHARFDDTSSGVSSPAHPARSRREALPANPHRHQHQLAGAAPNGTAGGWHGRRGGGAHRHQQQQQQQLHRNNESNLERNERSANLSHITGATRKIQLFIKNRYIQLLPDGTVNGTYDDLSDYSEYRPVFATLLYHAL